MDGRILEISIVLDPVPPMDVMKEATLNLMAHIPREEIVYFRTRGDSMAVDNVSAQFPYLRALHFEKTALYVAFPKPTPGIDGEIFPSLQHLTLDRASARDDDWGPLTTFLAHRASSGNQLDTLETRGSHPPHPGAEEGIRRAVREFRMTDVSEF